MTWFLENLSSYDFFAPRQIVFGWGRRGEIGRLAKPLGQRAFLISGSRTLERSTAVFEQSKLAREFFGDAFVDHFAATREWEWRQFQDAVTDWEFRRYFEII